MVASIETKVAVKQILLDLTPYLDEKQKRILYGSAASVLGHGGSFFARSVFYFEQIIWSTSFRSLILLLLTPHVTPSNSSFSPWFRPQFWKILSLSRQFFSVKWRCSIFIQLKSFRIGSKRVFGLFFGRSNETKRKPLEV